MQHTLIVMQQET